MKDLRYEPMANGRPQRVPMEATPHGDVCVAQQHRPPPQPGAHGIKRMPVRFTPERLHAQA